MSRQSMIATLASLLCLTVAAQAAAGAAGKRILSLKKTCAISVPADWQVDKWVSSDAFAPDKSGSAVIDSNTSVGSLAEVKPIVQSMLKPTKIFEDSPQRLWYQYEGSGGGSTSWYVGVPGNGGICAAQITFRKTLQAELARQIAMSVGPAT
ncbi:hypothetical protein B0E46_12005 [Rhodanobacter sp. B04]|uniref:hypothetical protein n=1 Tax=Rhodanobacter sp. B04 TaxID=1945860 RepID=UPI0009CCB789|nr:hypothetical protein [Rhodanobacter sp. B04]OOG62927.1 hypothetical protein B0E46_12005 [Rhodanobacter sp. B04]